MVESSCCYSMYCKNNRICVSFLQMVKKKIRTFENLQRFLFNDCYITGYIYYILFPKKVKEEIYVRKKKKRIFYN